ncbi:glycosyltransferase family 4 protein [Wohlfahrtiimonas chitiniclastica]|uniref:glycosyltransferase family 4 protein n=1 Tax=Wohlfahrtiimonas chitiniclastica TaxID=400946 RepID=UPI001BCD105B|nr:glycosyltransferase family 4 protein [Wohlfahrtiimonas chitiniclastica]MBS7817043.1 glycosyltransferase family 4 protein [Wohlfahrtiimonas chitiniclastica]MBS7822753.1 glycosyltransferase family 4 protein [Wohlfahrtiimonas chitiniclastica]MBS7830568.1 glycosyltransferase family 4 protein [Wohlfahrtiimonas chitiniclastica]MBS7832604.1 glycosyltransferase family 4 protein [Wohlfahrtiimonas chitiniclastica]
MSKKNIWIIHQYASTPETGMGGRHFYLADELGKLGYTVYVIAAGYTHLLRTPPKIENDFLVEKRENFTFVWVNMPHYLEAHSKQRVLNWFLFPWRIQKLAKVIPNKPDVILCSSPSPIAFLGAEKLAKKFKACLAFEVRDIWPLTLVELGGYSPKHPFIRFMQWIEDRAYQKADVVISNLKNSVEHMVGRGMNPQKFHWIPNGVSLAEISEHTPLNNVSQKLLPKDKFIIGYTGTLGIANALDTLIKAAHQLKDYQDKLAFVLVGHGKEKEHLQTLIDQYKLTNIYILDAIPKKEIQAMLSYFDACYIGWKNDPLYLFGIGANKIPEYIYSGKPILHSYSGVCDPIKECKLGITTPAENIEALAQAILDIYQTPQNERDQITQRAKQAIFEQYEYGLLAKQLSHILFNEGKS